MSIKQDRARVRTAHDLERKYSLGNQKELMKELRSAIAKTEQLMANKQSDKFETTIKIFLEPGEEERTTIAQHIAGIQTIPSDKIKLYDFDNSGSVTAIDERYVKQAQAGTISLANWENAVKSDVTVTIDMSTPEKIISIKGTNMWGREVELKASELIADMLLDVDFLKTDISDLESRVDTLESNSDSSGGSSSGTDYIVERGTTDIWTYEVWNSGKTVCWGKSEPGAVEYYDSGILDACYHNYNQALPSIFTSEPTHICITPITGSDEWAFTSVARASQYTLGWRTLLFSLTGAGDHDVSFYIEVSS